MKVKRLMVIDSEGIKEMITVLRPLNVDSKVIAKLSQAVTRKMPNVFKCPGSSEDSQVQMVVGQKLVGFTVDLDYINLTTHFALNDQKELYACFDSTTAPVMTMKWMAPMNMVLSLVILCPLNKMQIETQYLVATFDHKALYRLPLPNLYETGALCAGKFPNPATDYQTLVAGAVNQFHNSPWNCDLLGRGEFDRTGPPRLFRFKPKGETVIEQINDVPDWEKFCTTISDINLITYYYYAN